MGIDFDFGFFVDDRDFIPSRQKLLGVASILEKAGVVDHSERFFLQQEIFATYLGYDDHPMPQEDHGASYYFAYEFASPKSFPYFNYSHVSGIFDEQCLEIYGNPRCMQPMAGDHYTRFVIAYINDALMGQETQLSWEKGREMNRDPVLAFLRTHIEELLVKHVIIETCMT
jgi:hypothetical protein